MYMAYLFSSRDSLNSQASLKLYEVNISPYNSDTLIDVVTVRKTPPPSYNHQSLIDSRRIIPSFQYKPSTFLVEKTKSNGVNSIKVSFKTSGCLTDLKPIEFIGYSDPSAAIVRTSTASARVTGTFDLAWNGNFLRNIDASISAYNLTALIQSLNGFGSVSVVRSKDCYGYKWNVKWSSGGKKIPFTIDNNALIGDSVTINAIVKKTGGLNFNPVPGVMLRSCKFLFNILIR